jgi:hypothetical protein
VSCRIKRAAIPTPLLKRSSGYSSWLCSER